MVIETERLLLRPPLRKVMKMMYLNIWKIRL